jgi:hypothetical protein
MGFGKIFKSERKSLSNDLHSLSENSRIQKCSFHAINNPVFVHLKKSLQYIVFRVGVRVRVRFKKD